MRRLGLLAVALALVTAALAGTVAADEVEDPTGHACLALEDDAACDRLAVNRSGNATGGTAVSGTGDATGAEAVSGTGDARAGILAVSGTGDASANVYAVSGTGNATTSYLAVSGTGDASKPRSGAGGYTVSGTGDATCNGNSACFAVSGTGEASCSALLCLAVSGCEVGQGAGTEAACQDVEPGGLLP